MVKVKEFWLVSHQTKTATVEFALNLTTRCFIDTFFSKTQSDVIVYINDSQPLSYQGPTQTRCFLAHCPSLYKSYGTQ